MAESYEPHEIRTYVVRFTDGSKAFIDVECIESETGTWSLMVARERMRYNRAGSRVRSVSRIERDYDYE